MKKKILSLLLTTVMVITLIPAVAFSTMADAEVTNAGAVNDTDIKTVTLTGSTISGGALENIYDGKAQSTDTGAFAASADKQFDFSAGSFGAGSTYRLYFTIQLNASCKVDHFDIYPFWGNYGNSADNDGVMDAFDVFVSANGTTWAKVAEYSDLCGNGSNAGANFESSFNLNWADEHGSGSNRPGMRITSGLENEIQYIRIAAKEGCKNDGRCYVFEVEVAPVSIPTLVECANEAELRSAISTYGSYAETTIRLTNDIILSTQSTLGTVSGTFDGGDHTFYNVGGTVNLITPAAGATIENFTVSNLTAPEGSEISAGKGNILGYEISGGTELAPTRIINVRNERNGSNGGANGDWQAAFISKYYGGNIEFINCVNTGDMAGWPAGGFIADVKANGSCLTFTNCVNTGNISSSANAGGLIGIINDFTATVIMTGCKNTGTITATRTNNIAAAGGLIGSVAAAYALSNSKDIRAIGCVNTGDILADTTTGIAGGLIGDGNTKGTNKSAPDTAVSYLIDNCAVYDCAIVGKGNGAYDSSAAFIGRAYLCTEEGNAAANMSITVRNSYVSNATVTAVNTRKYVGVTRAADGAKATIENCFSNEYKVKDYEGVLWPWDGIADANANCAITAAASATNGFTDTDTDNVIIGGAAPAYQTNDVTVPSKIRFVSTLPADISGYAKVGYFVTASYNGGADTKGWVLESTTVYSSILANDGLETRTADSIHTGDAYIFALTVEDLPQGLGAVTFYATPFVVKNDGSILFGQTGTYNINIGSNLLSATYAGNETVIPGNGFFFAL